MAPQKTRKVFREALVELRASLRALYRLAPAAVILVMLIVAAVTALASMSAAAKVVIVLMIVFLVALIVYTTTSRYGEAALALAAGLFSVYSVDWTTANFISFVSVWVGFSLLVLLIASIRLAARYESLVRDASLILAKHPDSSDKTELQLRKIAESSEIKALDPIERAVALRVFCMRKLPLDAMAGALRQVELLSVITQADSERVARFIADVHRVFDAVAPGQAEHTTDLLYGAIRDSAVPPDDFFSGFESSRHLVLSRALRPIEYLSRLRAALENGVQPSAVGDYLKESMASAE